MVRKSLFVQSPTKQEAIRRTASDVKGHRRDTVDEDAASSDPLTALRVEFDRELAVLRKPGAANKLRKIFASAPSEIAKAANATKRKR
ncbi:MAG TPA: hypothetical protein VF713_25100 [Thermoanaerobaculia bacterium]